MAKLEEVICSLERCTCNVPDACRDCAYDYKPAPNCWLALERDALELLKAQEARELTKEEWEAWKKSPRRDPICMVYYQDTTPIWVLDPTAINEVSYYMGRIKLFTNKPGKGAVEWG